jgi:capsular polysaccharide biosynthesis protein
MNISVDCFTTDSNDNTHISRNEICSTLCENKHTFNMIMFLYIPLFINIISTILSVIIIKSFFNYYKHVKKRKTQNKSSQCNEINISQVVLHPFENYISLAIPENI